MEGGKELWASFVERMGGGKRDPSLRDPSELQAFLSEVDPDNSIAENEGKGSAEHANLVSRVKSIQKREGNARWRAFIDRLGGGKRDPFERTLAELEAFLSEADPDGATESVTGKYYED